MFRGNKQNKITIFFDLSGGVGLIYFLKKVTFLKMKRVAINILRNQSLSFSRKFYTFIEKYVNFESVERQTFVSTLQYLFIIKRFIYLRLESL